MTTCYLVVGPESAGNRMLAACLLASGCEGEATARGSGGYNERLPDGEDRAVVIRTFPHGGRWPHLDGILEVLLGRYDLVTVLVTCRHPVALWGSQVGRGHVSTAAEAHDNSRQAWVLIMAALGRHWGVKGLEWFLVPYESLEGGGAAELCRQLQLPGSLDLVEVEGERVPLENRNRRHFTTRMEAT